MPHHEISIEDVLCKTKDRKSSKNCCPKKVPPCNVECCITDCNPDCCTAAFQRLDKLRMDWLGTQQGMSLYNSPVYTRAAQPVTINSSYLPLEATSAAFVNTVRYLNFEECGKLDQVTGWSVDVQTGDLYFYQNLPEVGLTAGSSGSSNSRAYLLNNYTCETMTPVVKKQLAEMEPFWKLSLRAVERVRENPKTEGNICEIKDKCGNKFLVAINRANSQPGSIPGENGQSICNYTSQYSIVAVKLC
jgi:hypothetical protein